MLIDFHGWEMPVRYTSIPQEHQQVRESAGLFDLCHMGRLAISGPQAEEWLQALITNDTAAIETGNARYTLFCQEDGTILDDAIVYRLEESFLLVVNASNTTKIIDWMTSHRDGREAELEDLTRSEAMISIQGPDALACTTPLLEAPESAWDKLGYYQIISAQYESEPVLAARTGYTGEDGLELYLAGDPGVRLWRQLLETGGNRTAPIGLGARDTLRLEAGMPLYGNDIDETGGTASIRSVPVFLFSLSAPAASSIRGPGGYSEVESAEREVETKTYRPPSQPSSSLSEASLPCAG